VSTCCSPRPPYLAVWNNNQLQVWDVAAGQMRYHLPPAAKPSGIRTVAFSRDGRRVACAHNDGQVALIDCVAGSLVHEWGLPAQPLSLAVSGDGHQIAVGSMNGLIQVHRLSLR